MDSLAELARSRKVSPASALVRNRSALIIERSGNPSSVAAPSGRFHHGVSVPPASECRTDIVQPAPVLFNRRCALSPKVQGVAETPQPPIRRTKDMNDLTTLEVSRRTALGAGLGLAVSTVAPLQAHARTTPRQTPETGDSHMQTITTKDGTRIFYKDLGSGQTVVLHHGWPLASDEWDAQVLFFLQHGFRVIAPDRRGHGRSDATTHGNEMDTYAADMAALAEALDLRGAVHIGHSTGGGEVTRYVARHGNGRVAKAVLIAAVPPIMVKTPANPGGQPIEVFDGMRSALAANRSQLYLDIARGPFYGFNRPDAKVYEGTIRNWWRQGMIGDAHAHYECIKAFSETDFTDDLKAIDVPVLVMHGDDDQIVPIADSALLSTKLLKMGQLKVYKGFPHGMATTHADVINPDLLAFIRS
jgi:non-heme chloroperoxidase